ncbi:MAG: AmmeMemoRadiSam system protein A [Planctomycetota bacterium]
MSAGTIVGSVEQQRQLLDFARQTARRILENATTDSSPVAPQIDGRFGGVFVTFWSGRTLRGCVGTFASTTDLAATIAEVTRSSLADARFESDPITAAELPDLEMEISILTDPQPTRDPLSLIPGTHGIIVRRGGRSGCFLPRTASERGWSVVQFLSNCCTMKAGLDAEAWGDPQTQVLLFTADSFRESEFA